MTSIGRGAFRVGIIGGGIAGLVAGYELAKGGAQVTILERSGRLGGLAGSFALEPGQEIEKYYHFICKPDKPYFDLLRQMDLDSRLRWKVTEMGLFYHGNVHPIGDPLSLFTIPYLTLGDKVRFGWSAALAKFRNSTSWKSLESMPAEVWLVDQYGKRTYNMLYGPLLDLKFREHAPRISAAWMWARFHRLGNSRTITQKEQIGYVEGGTQAVIDALEQRLLRWGADLRVRAPAERVIIERGRATGVQCNGEELPFDHVLSTAPIPMARNLLRQASGPYFDNLYQLEYVDVLVMVMRLRRQFSPYFWLNVSDPSMDLAGIIEYTNLNPCPELDGDAILYLPQYLSANHPFYEMSHDDLFAKYCQYLSQINPSFEPQWVREYWVHRNRFAQPICDLGFSQRIPPMETPIEGLYLTDSAQLYPDDRAVSGSVELGINAARLILSKGRMISSYRPSSVSVTSQASSEPMRGAA